VDLGTEVMVSSPCPVADVINTTAHSEISAWALHNASLACDHCDLQFYMFASTVAKTSGSLRR